MMILRSTAPSPFGRKVRLAAAILDLEGAITVEPADTGDPNDSLRRANPLGKLPTLVLEDGTALFDSRVILEFLDVQAGGGRIIPKEGQTRFSALRLQALSDGLMDAAILQVYETRWRSPDKHEPKWLAYQAEKAARALAALEADPPATGGSPTVGTIALACALGYLDFRFAGEWRARYPGLVAWLEDFAGRVPGFGATRPPG